MLKTIGTGRHKRIQRSSMSLKGTTPVFSVPTCAYSSSLSHQQSTGFSRSVTLWAGHANPFHADGQRSADDSDSDYAYALILCYMMNSLIFTPLKPFLRVSRKGAEILMWFSQHCFLVGGKGFCPLLFDMISTISYSKTLRTSAVLA